jgi:hypothetical protein
LEEGEDAVDYFCGDRLGSHGGGLVDTLDVLYRSHTLRYPMSVILGPESNLKLNDPRPDRLHPGPRIRTRFHSKTVD